MKPRIEAALKNLLGEVATLNRRSVKVEELGEVAAAISSERDRLSTEAALEEALEREALRDTAVVAAIEAAKARIIAARASASNASPTPAP